jgi:hypothetical protein
MISTNQTQRVEPRCKKVGLLFILFTGRNYHWLIACWIVARGRYAIVFRRWAGFRGHWRRISQDCYPHRLQNCPGHFRLDFPSTRLKSCPRFGAEKACNGLSIYTAQSPPRNLAECSEPLRGAQCKRRAPAQ